MNEADYPALLDSLREHVRSWRPEVDDSIMHGFEFADDPRASLTNYIDRLIQWLSSRSERTYRATLDLLNTHIEVPRGGRIHDIRVILSPAEADYFHAEYVSLSGDHGLDNLIGGLSMLRNRILNSEH